MRNATGIHRSFWNSHSLPKNILELPFVPRNGRKFLYDQISNRNPGLLCDFLHLYMSHLPFMQEMCFWKGTPNVRPMDRRNFLHSRRASLLPCFRTLGTPTSFFMCAEGITCIPRIAIMPWICAIITRGVCKLSHTICHVLL